jgi:hypothetical protein
LQPAERIGCREAGVAEIKQHPFFRSIDWDAIYMKEIAPPFVPTIKEVSDVSNVDPEFLAESPTETPVIESALAAMAQREGDFDNFTYVNEHNLSELQASIDAPDYRRPMTELVSLDMKASFNIAMEE